MFIVMELMEGNTLKELIDAQIDKGLRLEEHRIWHIFMQLCTALRYLHVTERVVHRDLKPANVGLDWDDRVKIADFGLARQKITDASLMSSSCGSMQYSCPEIVQHKEYGADTDIWASGCILYELAMLKPPFDCKQFLGLARQICEGTYAPLDDCYSADMGRVVAKCLSKDRADRPDISRLAELIAPILLDEVYRLDSEAAKKDSSLHHAQMLKRRYRTESATHQRVIKKMAGELEEKSGSRPNSGRNGSARSRPNSGRPTSGQWHPPRPGPRCPSFLAAPLICWLEPSPALHARKLPRM